MLPISDTCYDRRTYMFVFGGRKTHEWQIYYVVGIDGWTHSYYVRYFSMGCISVSIILLKTKYSILTNLKLATEHLYKYIITDNTMT